MACFLPNPTPNPTLLCKGRVGEGRVETEALIINCLAYPLGLVLTEGKAEIVL